MERVRDAYKVDSDLAPIEFESVFVEISDEDYRDSAAMARLRETYEDLDT